jgi:hypothetical protein
VAASKAGYFVDWYGFASWEAHPVFGAYVRLVHADERPNIAVFSRR